MDASVLEVLSIFEEGSSQTFLLKSEGEEDHGFLGFCRTPKD